MDPINSQQNKNDGLSHQAWFYFTISLDFTISLVLFFGLLYWGNDQLSKLNQRVNYCQSVQGTGAVTDSQVFEKRLENLEGKYIDVLASKDTINFWLTVLTILLPVSLGFFAYEKGKIEDKADKELRDVQKKAETELSQVKEMKKEALHQIELLNHEQEQHKENFNTILQQYKTEAKKEFDALVKAGKTQMKISIMFNDALRFYESKDYNKAIENYNKLIELTQKSKIKNQSALYVYYYNRGLAYFKLKQNEMAISDYTKAINNEEKDAAYYNRGLAYIKMKKYSEAIGDFETAFRLLPENKEFFMLHHPSNLEELRKIPEFQEFLKKHNI